MHQPPHALELEERMSKMCAFANGETPKEFVHPAIRSIILHFWLAYDHPFVDGNGRTARALFYWSMLRHGFWLFEFISISPVIRRAYGKYKRAFLETETDDNDLTYFILNQLETIRTAVKDLEKYLARKADQLKSVERKMRDVASLNHRQKALIGHAIRHPGYSYTIATHQSSHQVVYETARNYLLDLEKRGLVSRSKAGRTNIFTPVPDLEDRLRRLS